MGAQDRGLKRQVEATQGIPEGQAESPQASGSRREMR